MLASIQQHAARHGKYIVPLMSCSIDFYVRLFVRVYSKQVEVKKAWSRVANVYQCSGCSAYHLQPYSTTKQHKTQGEYYVTNVKYDRTCDQCGWKYKLGGPIWSAPIHNQQFVSQCIDHVKQNQSLFSTHKRMIGMLTVISKELPDVPLFYTIPDLTVSMKTQSMPIVTFR